MRKRDRQLIELSRRLDTLGISLSDQEALRRIEMTLHRWAELECGDGNDYASWAIERDDETGKPYMVRHVYAHDGKGGATTYRHAIADREAGALKRLSGIMAKYPTLWYYHQSDPRGCALYVGRWADIPSETFRPPDKQRQAQAAIIDQYYTRGVAVCL